MNKLLISLPLALCTVGAVAIAATSQLAGEQAQKEYQRLLEQLNALSIAKFENESYEAGVSKSTAITRVLQGDENSEVLVLLHHDIDHSALKTGDDGLQLGTVSINTTLHDQDSLPEEMEDMFTDSTPFRLITDIQTTGEVRNRFTISSIEQESTGEGITWDGLEMDITTIDQSSIGSGTIGEFSLVSEKEGIDMGFDESPMSIDLVFNEIVTYTGSADVVFNNIRLKAPQRPTVKVERFAVESESQINDDALDSSVLVDINGIESMIPLNNASLDFAFNGLVLDGVSLLNTFLEPANASPDFDENANAQLIEIASALFQPGTLMNYDLVLNNDGGDVLADAKLAIKEIGEDGMTEDALEKVVTQRDLLNLLNLDATLNAETSALALTPIMMFLGSAGQFITITEDAVTSTVSLDGSVLNVNGVLLDLDTMVDTLDVPLTDLPVR